MDQKHGCCDLQISRYYRCLIADTCQVLPTCCVNRVGNAEVRRTVFREGCIKRSVEEKPNHRLRLINVLRIRLERRAK